MDIMTKFNWLNKNSRDFLSRGYLGKGVTAEQRVKDICDNAERILGIEGFSDKLYGYCEKGWVSFSSPIWANFGLRALPISCYGSCSADNMESILETNSEIGMMTKLGGGTSLFLGDLRHRGAAISTGGQSEGAVHFAKLTDSIIDICKQADVRRGACAVYLPIDHKDIDEFLEIGSEGHPIQNLQYGVTIPDEWMESMIEEDRNKRKIWAKVIKSRVDKGFPYILFSDTANKNAPSCYKKHGKTIKASNLCMSGDQRVVTSKGILTAKELYESGEDLELFDGEKLVNSSPMRMISESADVYKVTLSTGQEHKVTAEHGMAVMNKSGKVKRVECKDLKIGDQIAVQTSKGLFGNVDMVKEAFLLGWYQSDGTQHKDLIMIDVWENDFDLIDLLQEHHDYVCDKYNTQVSKYNNRVYNRPRFHNCQTGQSDVKKKRLAGKALKKALNFEKGYVPEWIWESNESTQWSYVKGLLYTDGTVGNCNSYGAPCHLAYSDINLQFLKELQIIFNNLGLQSKIYMLRKAGKSLLPDGKGGNKYYDTKDCWRLVVSNKRSLLEIEKHTGFLSRKNVKLDDRVYRDNTKKRSKIVSIEYVGKEPVYCPTVYTDEHIFIAQGLKTFNCSEILLFSSPEESFVCCLSSVNLLHWDEWRYTDLVETMIFFLDAVMSEFIFKARAIPYMKRAVKFAEEQRALGLGVLGWHSLLQYKGIPIESMEAKYINASIFKTIRSCSDAATEKLARMYGTPLLLEGESRRNVTTLAVAPTKSSSFILGQVSMGIEPIKSNYFIKDLAKSKTIYKNPFLKKLLAAKGMDTKEIWDSILSRDGSVQHLEGLSQREKDTFKTFMEIAQIELVRQNADRQKYIDQGISFNLSIHPEVSAKDINTLYIEAWKAGIKTLYYQFSENSAQSFSREILNCSACE